MSTPPASKPFSRPLSIAHAPPAQPPSPNEKLNSRYPGIPTFLRTQDVYHTFKHEIVGYPRLAGRMGAIPEAAMFRRFGALNARNLLYLQSELIELEVELRKVEYEDSQSHLGCKSQYAFDHYYLSTSENMKGGTLRDGEPHQLHLMKRIREVLREYNTALIQQAEIVQMKRPDSYDIEDIQKFLYSEHMSGSLVGPDINVWGKPDEKGSYSRELICLRPRQDTDTFSRWVGAHAITYILKCGCKRFKKKDERTGALFVRSESISKYTFWTTSIMASMIPVSSIMVLIRISSLQGRLGVIAGFNVLVSICLTIFTESKRTDVFAVTAAFAAVQVVFVGQALDDSPTEAAMAAASTLVNRTCNC